MAFDSSLRNGGNPVWTLVVVDRINRESEGKPVRFKRYEDMSPGMFTSALPLHSNPTYEPVPSPGDMNQMWDRHFNTWDISTMTASSEARAMSSIRDNLLQKIAQHKTEINRICMFGLGSMEERVHRLDGRNYRQHIIALKIMQIMREALKRRERYFCERISY